VPGPDFVVLLEFPISAYLPVPAGVLAYGPGPPVDLIPYFLALVAWAGLAFVAILLSPLNALLRRLRRFRGGGGALPPVPKSTPMSASVPESSGEDSHDRA
jgi:hypothetical protein